MFEFTIKSTKDVKKINIVFGDDNSEVSVDALDTSSPEPVSEPVMAPEPVAPPTPKTRAAKAAAPPEFDPFERASSKTNYGVKEKPKAVAVEPEPVEEVTDRPDKVDLDFGNSSF